MPTVAESLTATLAAVGVKRIYGIVGDSLNRITDAMRRQKTIEWIHVRHCVQFEDWAGVDAVRLLARYRERICSFNDDVRGTAAVALAGILGALRITGRKLSEQTVLFLGAGSAGTGIAELLTQTITLEGISPEKARTHTWLFDVNGLLESSRNDLADFQKPYAHPHAPVKNFVEGYVAHSRDYHHPRIQVS